MFSQSQSIEPPYFESAQTQFRTNNHPFYSSQQWNQQKMQNQSTEFNYSRFLPPPAFVKPSNFQENKAFRSDGFNTSKVPQNPINQNSNYKFRPPINSNQFKATNKQPVFSSQIPSQEHAPKSINPFNRNVADQTSQAQGSKLMLSQNPLDQNLSQASQTQQQASQSIQKVNVKDDKPNRMASNQRKLIANLKKNQVQELDKDDQLQIVLHRLDTLQDSIVQSKQNDLCEEVLKQLQEQSSKIIETQQNDRNLVLEKLDVIISQQKNCIQSEQISNRQLICYDQQYNDGQNQKIIKRSFQQQVNFSYQKEISYGSLSKRTRAQSQENNQKQAAESLSIKKQKKLSRIQVQKGIHESNLQIIPVQVINSNVQKDYPKLIKRRQQFPPERMQSREQNQQCKQPKAIQRQLRSTNNREQNFYKNIVNGNGLQQNQQKQNISNNICKNIQQKVDISKIIGNVQKGKRVQLSKQEDHDENKTQNDKTQDSILGKGQQVNIQSKEAKQETKQCRDALLKLDYQYCQHNRQLRYIKKKNNQTIPKDSNQDNLKKIANTQKRQKRMQSKTNNITTTNHDKSIITRAQQRNLTHQKNDISQPIVKGNMHQHQVLQSQKKKQKRYLINVDNCYTKIAEPGRKQNKSLKSQNQKIQVRFAKAEAKRTSKNNEFGKIQKKITQKSKDKNHVQAMNQYPNIPIKRQGRKIQNNDQTKKLQCKSKVVMTQTQKRNQDINKKEQNYKQGHICLENDKQNVINSQKYQIQNKQTKSSLDHVENFYNKQVYDDPRYIQQNLETQKLLPMEKRQNKRKKGIDKTDQPVNGDKHMSHNYYNESQQFNRPDNLSQQSMEEDKFSYINQLKINTKSIVSNLNNKNSQTNKNVKINGKSTENSQQHFIRKQGNPGIQKPLVISKEDKFKNASHQQKQVQNQKQFARSRGQMQLSQIQNKTQYQNENTILSDATSQSSENYFYQKSDKVTQINQVKVHTRKGCSQGYEMVSPLDNYFAMAQKEQNASRNNEYYESQQKLMDDEIFSQIQKKLQKHKNKLIHQNV